MLGSFAIGVLVAEFFRPLREPHPRDELRAVSKFPRLLPRHLSSMDVIDIVHIFDADVAIFIADQHAASRFWLVLSQVDPMS